MHKPILKRTAMLIGCMLFCAVILPDLVFAGKETRTDKGLAKSTKFERDLESLFGAALATKYGEMTIRQRKDSAGRVRKQILVGPSYSEIQLDENGDGTVDFWEITRGEKTVSAANPSRGRFLRMNVTERTKEGTFEAFYILGLDGRRYNLLRTKFDRADRKMYSESVPDSFDATDVPDAPPVTASSETSTSAVDSGQSSEAERFELEDQSWREYQSKTWGQDLICVSDETESGRLAALQRDWWKIIKRDVENRADRLAEKLKESNFFDVSCKVPARKKDFEKIAKSLSELMMTSSKGEPSGAREGAGYLRCLEQSGLGKYAAKIEQNFLSGMNDPYRAERPIRCDFKPGAAGLAQPAWGSGTSKQVVVHICLPDEAKGIAKTADGSTQTYKNVLFHELIHVAGIESETMTHAAQACCGEATADRAKACAKLDKLVAEERRFAELEAFLTRDVSMAPLQAELNAKFDAKGTADLYRQFLLGLDKTGIIDNEEFTKCVQTSTETACREKWIKSIEKYADSFFKKDCRKIVVGLSQSNCSKVSGDFKNRLATTIANSMIELKSDRDPSEPQLCRLDLKNNGLGDRTAWLVPKFILQKVFGLANAMEDVDCDPAISLPIDMGIKSPTFSVPGTADNDTVGSRPGGDSSVVNRPSTPTSPVRIPDRSPLPVTDVTSPGSGRTVAERSYQRATDFAGAATRGFKDLRDSIVPRAVAADRSDGRANRLSGEDSFVAFRPTKSDLKAIKIDNPFAEGRPVASLILPKGGSASASKSQASANDLDSSKAGGSGVVQGAIGQSQDGQTSRQSAGKGKSGQRGDGDNIVRSSQSAEKDGSAVDPKSQANSLGTKSPTSRGPAQVSPLLEGLFTLRYRLIEGRLNDLKLQQLLIDRGIKVISSDGRLIGAKKVVKTCYKYVGQELPLKTPCEN